MDTNTSLFRLLINKIIIHKSLFRKFLLFIFFVSIILSMLIPPRYNSSISFYAKKNESTSNINGFDLSQLMLGSAPVTTNHEFSIIDILSSNDIFDIFIL